MPFSPNALLLALAATCCFGISNFLSAPISRRMGPLRALFLFEILGVPLLLLLLPWQELHFSGEALFCVALLGLVCIVSMLLFFYALKAGQVSVVVPLNEQYVLVALLISVLVFHESIGYFKQAAMLLLIVGMSLVGLDFSSSSRRISLFAGVLPALLSALVAGFYFVGVGYTTRSYGWYQSALGIRVSMSLLLGLLVWIRRDIPTAGAENLPVPTRPLASKLPWKLLLGAVVCDVVGFSFYSLAVAQAEVSYVTAIISAASLISILLSWRFLGERLKRYQVVGALLVVLGIATLQLG